MLVRRSLLLAILLGGVGACAAPPTPPTPNGDLLALERVVGWDGAPVEAVFLLLSECMLSERIDDGHRFFAARAARSPDVPIFSAAEALFQVQLAGDVSLLHRKAYVTQALETLDRAAERDPGASRFVRALVEAQLPSMFGRAESAATVLAEMTAEGSELPRTSLRPAYFALARALDTLGRDVDAEQALRLSGHTALDAIAPDNGNEFTYTPSNGVRFTRQEFVEELPGVFGAYGYDFAEMYFIVGDDGVIAIDAGSTVAAAQAAKAELRRHTSLPITHLILTHMHWDHVGGVAGMVEEGTQVIVNAKYAHGLEALNDVRLGEIGLYLGGGLPETYALTPSLVVSEPVSLTVGGRELQIVPTTGGETGDALLVHLPREKTVFAGDVLFLSVGVPFLEEGSPEGLVSVLGELRALGADRVLQGHRPMNDLEGPAVFEGLQAALAALHAQVLEDLRAGRTVAESRDAGFVPDVLRQHPESALAYLLARENFVRRMYDQRTGYWQTDGEQMELHSSTALAEAIDLVGGGRADAFTDAIDALLARGDYRLAATLADYGVRAHPDDAALSAAWRRAMVKVTDKYQTWDANKYPMYAGRLGLELPEPATFRPPDTIRAAGR